MDKLDRRMSVMPQFQGLCSNPQCIFSTLTQLTGKEYRELTRVYLVAVVPLLLRHLKHFKVIQTAFDFTSFAGYKWHGDSTSLFLVKSLQASNKLEWICDERRLGSKKQQLECFDIPKLYALTSMRHG